MMTGVTEILVVVALVAVFFGPGKLPQVMEALGQGVKTFKGAAEEAQKPRSSVPSDDEPPPAS